MKRFIVLVLLVTVGLAPLFGGGSREQADDGVTTLVVWEWISTEGEGEVLQALLAEFDAQNPDIRIESLTTPWGQARDEILLMSQAGNVPDLIGVNRNWLHEFVQLNMLEDLTPYVESVPGLRTKFYEPVRGEMDGTVYVLPYSGGNSALVYNQGEFRARGLQPPTTLEEFVEIGRELSNPAQNQFGTAWALSEANVTGANVVNIGPLLTSFGGQYVVDGRAAFNSEAGLATLEWMMQMEEDGIAAPGSTTIDAREMRELMAGETIFMTVDGAWGTPFYNQYPEIEIGIAPMPRGLEVGTVVNIMNWGIPQAAENKDEAWRLLEFLMEDENLLRLYREGNVMPVTAEHGGMEEFTEIYAGFLETLDQSQNFFQTGSVPQESELYRIVVDAYQEAFLGAKTPQQALDDAAAAYDRILEDISGR
jgi:ABC-type glycerol-3-phosphate transport system substrate-binding protein